MPTVLYKNPAFLAQHSFPFYGGGVVGHFVRYYIACQKSQNWLEPVRVEFGEKGETRAVVVESCLVF